MKWKRKELEAENQRLKILRNANHQAQDIYAASVIYSEDALGRIQDIISQSEQETKKILKNLNREMESSLKHKFAKKPEVLEGNMQALYKAFEAVELVSRPAGRVSSMPSKDRGYRYTASLQSGQLARAAGMHA